MYNILPSLKAALNGRRFGDASELIRHLMNDVSDEDLLGVLQGLTGRVQKQMVHEGKPAPKYCKSENNTISGMSIPTDIIGYVFRFLEPQELMPCGLTSPLWSDVMNGPIVWEGRVLDFSRMQYVAVLGLLACSRGRWRYVTRLILPRFISIHLLEKLRKCCPQIERVRYQNSHDLVKSRTIGHIPVLLPEIQYLDISYSKWTMYDLTNMVQHAANLRVLILRSSKRQDFKGFGETLGQCTRLEQLDISEDGPTSYRYVGNDADILCILRGCRRLEVLSVSGLVGLTSETSTHICHHGDSLKRLIAARMSASFMNGLLELSTYPKFKSLRVRRNE